MRSSWQLSGCRRAASIAAESELEQIAGQIADTKARIARRAGPIRADPRAARTSAPSQAFMSGPDPDLELVLGATSLDDLSDRLEFVDAVAQSDAALAQAGREPRRPLLEIEEQNLEQLRRPTAARRSSPAALRDEILSVAGLHPVASATRPPDWSPDTIAKYQEPAERARTTWSSSRSRRRRSPPHTARSAARPASSTRSRCARSMPPRAFGDGFGAPRYVGGFHLHAGVDIVSDYGTPIRAPVRRDREARRTTRSAGTPCRSTAPDGYVYNAHLDHYSANSDGPVQAGDVIGYVGDTGDAGGTPHDHFEWHPDIVSRRTGPRATTATRDPAPRSTRTRCSSTSAAERLPP